MSLVPVKGNRSGPHCLIKRNSKELLLQNIFILVKKPDMKHSPMNQEINGYIFSMPDLWRKAGFVFVK